MSDHSARRSSIRLAVLLAALACLCACSGSQKESAVSVASEGSEAAPSAVAIGDVPGIHNLFVLGPGVYSGSGPEGEAGFDTLRDLGVRTVVSVDGARPELKLAHERGMRYVHVPIGYDGMDPEQEVALAKALRDLPGPVYFHCHHGKHRGPAAAAVAMIGAGKMSPAEAEAFMTAAGTSPSYPGLWACARGAAPYTDADLDSYFAELPEHQQVSGLIAGMVAIDETWERVGAVQAAGWRPTPEHPDVAPAAEAGILADHFRVLVADPETELEGEEFVAAMRLALDRAAALEAALANPTPDVLVAEAAHKAVAASCTDCHKAWRD